MKRLSGIIALLIFSCTLSFAGGDQDIATEKIKVSGTCSQCEKRIEDAAYIGGVKRAEWDKTSKELTVTYRPSKTSLKKIEESIAKAGHDAGDTKAADNDYNKLPECCAYRQDHGDH
ncbi:MAG: heavy-metal-associated domain-containing protein [Taibaiella sp.]